MVKSVDPDGTATVTDSKNEPEDVATPLSRDIHEGAGEVGEQVEEEEYGERVEEMSSPAPVILGGEGMSPNRTGKKKRGFHTFSKNVPVPVKPPTDS